MEKGQMVIRRAENRAVEDFSAFFIFGWTFVPWPFFPSGPIFRGPFFLHSTADHRTTRSLCRRLLKKLQETGTTA